MSDGLESVVAAETVLSHVDGAAGRLIYRGHMMEELAGIKSFEAVTQLFWDGFVPEAGDPEAFRAALGQARCRAAEIMAPVLPFTDGLSPIEAQRMLLSALPDTETTPHHLLVTAALPVFTAGIARRRAGLAPMEPSAELGQAADFLRMLRGAPAPESHVHALETYLVSVMDHGLNASTFTARVVASTRAGIFSSVVAALCALKGPLHGGAPGPVLDMLDAIGSEAEIVPWLESALDGGERLMGFGLRVYRVRDPRADVLKRVALTLRGQGNRILFAEAVEAKALEVLAKRKPDRRLDTNVEFYTALVLEALELPRDFFTPVFGVGRVVGWVAHILEQQGSSRIIRPQSRYVGPAVG
ncbi:MAG TPA: citrate synthase/methylcitrate synthase [Arenibaculum sp.]|nr:citrate synthase/methylcitrate synthase [Arenibaculum sp.]